MCATQLSLDVQVCGPVEELVYSRKVAFVTLPQLWSSFRDHRMYVSYLGGVAPRDEKLGHSHAGTARKGFRAQGFAPITVGLERLTRTLCGGRGTVLGRV
jgi:hypothetical protein